MLNLFLKKLSLRSFRNCSDSETEFNKKGNLITGGNGQGKTNFLESIYYLSVFRSFRGMAGADLAKWGSDRFNISAFFEIGSGIERCLEVSWVKGSRKEVSLDDDRVAKMSSLIGTFPMVIMSPESLEIAQGQPRMRRRFLDLCISTVDREYLQNLIAYKRVVRQRNSLLSRMSYDNAAGSGEIEPWNDKLVQHGSFIIKRRVDAVKILSELSRKMYSRISRGDEELSVEYISKMQDAEQIEEDFTLLLEQSRKEERRRKRTLIGPHRDDLWFKLDGHDARKYGSQGQQKTILLALKAAEAHYIAELAGMQPIVLLDDLFALLDRTRIDAFLRILQEFRQFFITASSDTNHDTILKDAGFDKSDFSNFTVTGGKILKN